MCGIAGTLSGPDAPLLDPDLARVLACMHHRGPDGNGTIGWTRPSSEFGPVTAGCHFAGAHTRLAILDRTSAADQPMLDGENRCALLYNGELYNHAALREQLTKAGHRFQSTGDTEVVLNSYLEWGPDTFRRFDGMFAIAIVDLRTRTLVLARDHLGIKPLYTWADGGRFAFASELPALRMLIGGRSAINPQALFDYLAFGWTDHGLDTFFQGIANFPAGHVQVIDLDAPSTSSPQPYWTLPTETVDISFADAADGVRSAFLESVTLQLRSDVPVGVMLSGGIDSAALVGGVSAVLGENVASITAYGYDAVTPELSERRWMSAAADHAGVRLQIETYDEQRALADLKELVVVHGEPVNSTSVFAQRRLYGRMAEDGVKVALGGQGADELFAGYHLLRRRMIDVAIRTGDFDSARRLMAYSSSDEVVDLETRQKQLRRRKRSGSADLAKLKLRGEWFSERGVDVEHPTSHQTPDSLHDALRDLLCAYSLPRLLRYDDRNAMSVSVENRVPYLARPLVELAFAMPARYLLSPFGCTKFVLREALGDLMPDVTRRRTDKIGFATPEGTIFRSRLAEITALIDSVGAELTPFLDREAVREEIERYGRGASDFDTVLWRWVNAVVWLEQTDAVIE